MAQIGTIKIRVDGSTTSIPVYDTADFSSGPIVKVKTGTDIGGINLVDPSD